jgi:hypothetical protein
MVPASGLMVKGITVRDGQLRSRGTISDANQTAPTPNDGGLNQCRLMVYDLLRIPANDATSSGTKSHPKNT